MVGSCTWRVGISGAERVGKGRGGCEVCFILTSWFLGAFDFYMTRLHLGQPLNNGTLQWENYFTPFI